MGQLAPGQTIRGLVAAASLILACLGVVAVGCSEAEPQPSEWVVTWSEGSGGERQTVQAAQQQASEGDEVQVDEDQDSGLPFSEPEYNSEEAVRRRTARPEEQGQPLEHVRSVGLSVGDRLQCALLEDASIRCWGNARYGQLEVPDGRYIAVSAGWAHACALREGGSVACWGDNTLGQSQPSNGQV